MLLTKEVEILVTPENKLRLEEAGYIIPYYYSKDNYKMCVKRGTTILVDVKYLTPSSHCMVKVKCDYCGEEKDIIYKEYYKNVNNKFVNKYACNECISIKKKDILIEKQKLGLLSIKDKGYWTFRENRLQELNNYITKYKTLNAMQMNKEGKNIYTIFTQYNDNIKSACIDLGYSYGELLKYNREYDYYNDYDNLKYDILSIYNDLGRFPKQMEVLKRLHISNNVLLKFGGIDKIRLDMGFKNKEDLIDNRGFNNRSVCEYMTAQYLIANNISYLREQHPFDGKYKNYRSDFTLPLLNGEIIQVEVWGYPKKDVSSKRVIDYNTKRILKEDLYNRYNYIFIGINYEVFYKQDYPSIQNSLYNAFKDYLNLEYKFISQELIIPPYKYTDKELLNELMKYSDDKNMLPHQDILDSKGKSGLYLEVLKRYSNYYNFAKAFGKNTYSKYNNWTKDNIFEGFQYMINNYNHILKNNEYHDLASQDRNITGFMEGVKKYYSSYIDARLHFYEYCLDNNLSLQELDIIYLNNLIEVKKGFNKHTSTYERIQIAKNILDNILIA